MKIKVKTEHKKTAVIITVIAVIVMAFLAFLFASFFNSKLSENTDELSGESTETTEVTDEEIAEFRERIGDTIKMKRSVLILFNTKPEADSFIAENGAKDDVLTLGLGIIPKLEEMAGIQFYNIVGNSVFELVFDTLTDGEHSKEPVEFGGMWAYFKRIDIYSPLADDNTAKEFVKNKKIIESED